MKLKGCGGKLILVEILFSGIEIFNELRVFVIIVDISYWKEVEVVFIWVYELM